MQQSDILTFPVYLLKREIIEFDGKRFVIPEPVVFDNVKDLALFIYERGLRPVSTEQTTPLCGSDSQR